MSEVKIDPAVTLLARMETLKTETLTALQNVDFYLQFTLTCAAFLLTLIFSAALQRQVQRSRSPLLQHHLSLLTPMLAVVFLAVAQSISASFLGKAGFLTVIVKLTLAWLGMRTVMLLIRNRVIARLIGSIIIVSTLLSVTGFLESTALYLDSLSLEFGKVKLSALGLIKGLIIFILVFWMAGALSRLTENALRRSSELSYNARELIVKLVTILFYFIAFVTTLNAVGIDLTALAVFGGALGVGIGLGLQKLTANFVSGITLLLEKSVKLNDLIEIGGQKGWIRKMNIRYTLIETADGRELLVPNEELISTKVTNWTYSHTHARVEIQVPVDYKSDARKAREIMLEAARNHPKCLKKQPITCHLRSFGDHGMMFELAFWVPDIHEGRANPQSDVMFTILEKFREQRIELACKKIDN